MCEPGDVRWLVVSVALSVVLTAVVNIGLRAFPGAGPSAARGLAAAAPPDIDDRAEHDRSFRVFVPWKAMIVGSVLLTIVVNVVLRVV